MKEPEIRDYFECERCGNRNFRAVYTFSLKFHKVNFSDELVYDRINEERFECTKCGAMYSMEQIREALRQIKRRRKSMD
jgi:predicted nucleic-acid-binding Zn-ribbon protein